MFRCGGEARCSPLLDNVARMEIMPDGLLCCTANPVRTYGCFAHDIEGIIEVAAKKPLWGMPAAEVRSG